MRDLTFYPANTPPLPLPCLDVDITLYYRLIEAADLPSLLVQKLDGQDRLTEVGHSVDSEGGRICGTLQYNTVKKN